MVKEEIEVHVLGGRKGESIVLRLPGDRWGVVDNYTPTLSKPESNPTLKFLKDRGVNHLSFICLTHPHDDHYRGLSQLVETFKPDMVWIFGAATHRYLWNKVAEVIKLTAASRNLDVADSEASDDLVRFLDLIQEEYSNKNRTPRLEISRLQLGNTLFELNGSPPLRVKAIGASGGRALAYESTLSECFDGDDNFLAEKVPNINHNQISGGLLIEYGKARVILGGDIDVGAWEETMAKITPGGLAADLVKASHHGSTNGYCENLWISFSPQRKAIAVLTPYTSQGLPSPDGLAHISGHAHQTLTVSLPATAFATDWHQNAHDTIFSDLSADVLVTLRGLFPKAAPRDRLEGICSFRVNQDGAVIETFSGHAGALSKTTLTI